MDICSVGHSNQAEHQFVDLLRSARVTILADIRSSPRSRFAHFSAAHLRAYPVRLGIEYYYLGDRLGGRPPPGLQADYEQMAASGTFKTGLNDLLGLESQGRVAMLCSEHEPLTCHRFLLVSRQLAMRGIPVLHILRDGKIERQSETEDRLLALTRQTEHDLLATREQRLALAYRSQELSLRRKKR